MRWIGVMMAALLLAGCSNDWEGVVYKDKRDLSDYERIGKFETFEECREATRLHIARMAQPGIADYDCGKGCISNDQGLFICQETRK